MREELSRLTKITVGDRVHQAERLGAVYQGSFDGVVPMVDIVRAIVADGFGLEVSEASMTMAFGSQTFSHFVWSGTADGALRAVSRQAVPPVYYYEHDGIIRFAQPGTAQPDLPSGLKVSPDTGMTGSATVLDDGARITCLLRPEIVVGAQIDIESDGLSGAYVVTDQRMDLDNWDGKFEMTLDLRSPA